MTDTAIQIDGVELEEDIYNRPVNFGILSASVRKEQKKAELYLWQLIYDVCEGLDGKYPKLWNEGKNVGNWNLPRYTTWDDETDYSSYEESPALEIIIRNDDKYYIVCGYDLIKNKFCLWIQNNKNGKSCIRYNNDISLPFGEIKSYYALKNILQEQLYDYYSVELNNLKNLTELK